MRKFRNAALAVATATTVAISGVSVAAAEEGTTPGSSQQQGGLKGSLELVGGGIAAAAAAVFGLVVAPAYNFLKYNGFLG